MQCIEVVCSGQCVEVVCSGQCVEVVCSGQCVEVVCSGQCVEVVQGLTRAICVHQLSRTLEPTWSLFLRT